MKKSVAMKWVKALRSGKYMQGIGQLRTRNDRFCCLGVLCDISRRSKWEQPDEIGLIYYDGSNSVIPECVKKWAGIASSAGTYKAVSGRDRCLADYNDGSSSDRHGESVSFTEIADWIERNYKAL
jgi:hypothetical protein